MEIGMPTLNTASTVAQWVAAHPQAGRVFEELQIDYCCGGRVALSTACGKKSLDAAKVVERLTQVIRDPQQPSDENWLQASLTSLCDHIEQTHHAYLRRELPRLTGLVDKVTTAHSEKHAELQELQQVYAALRAELEPHMFKEEQILFPAIRHIEASENRPQFPIGTLANPIHMMEHEHDTAGNALARIRELTKGFQPPGDACNTFRVMLDSLRQLEADLHQHIHKENNILFPRAQDLEAKLNSGAS
jgi:regulator of cell morphogenesis and NO signaling